MGNPANARASYSVDSHNTNTYTNRIDIWSSGSQGADSYIDNMTITLSPRTPVSTTSDMADKQDSIMRKIISVLIAVCAPVLGMIGLVVIGRLRRRRI